MERIENLTVDQAQEELKRSQEIIEILLGQLNKGRSVTEVMNHVNRERDNICLICEHINKITKRSTKCEPTSTSWQSDESQPVSANLTKRLRQP